MSIAGSTPRANGHAAEPAAPAEDYPFPCEPERDGDVVTWADRPGPFRTIELAGVDPAWIEVHRGRGLTAKDVARYQAWHFRNADTERSDRTSSYTLSEGGAPVGVLRCRERTVATDLYERIATEAPDPTPEPTPDPTPDPEPDAREQALRRVARPLLFDLATALITARGCVRKGEPGGPEPLARWRSYADYAEGLLRELIVPLVLDADGQVDGDGEPHKRWTPCGVHLTAGTPELLIWVEPGSKNGEPAYAHASATVAAFLLDDVGGPI